MHDEVLGKVAWRGELAQQSSPHHCSNVDKCPKEACLPGGQLQLALNGGQGRRRVAKLVQGATQEGALMNPRICNTLLTA